VGSGVIFRVQAGKTLDGPRLADYSRPNVDPQIWFALAVNCRLEKR
jgi:hypothetical protein